MSEIFEFTETRKKINSNTIADFSSGNPYVTRSEKNNGIYGYITYPKEFLNDGNTISLGMDTATFFYQKTPYFTGDKVKVLYLKAEEVNLMSVQVYLLAAIRKAFSNFGWGVASYNKTLLENIKLRLPVNDNNEPDWDYMKKEVIRVTPKYLDKIDLIYNDRINQLEIRKNSISEMAQVTNSIISTNEQKKLDELSNKNWREIKLSDIFDEIDRGKRLIEAHRLKGDLPFVTAGRINQGISNYISNPEVTKFKKNSLTIDMFGNTFLRDYEFGADDHVAVIREKAQSISRESLLFMVPIIEKAIKGKFDFSKNFYPSDVEDVIIKLPFKDKKIDFDYMDEIIPILEKVAINRYQENLELLQSEKQRHKFEINEIIESYLKSIAI